MKLRSLRGSVTLQTYEYGQRSSDPEDSPPALCEKLQRVIDGTDYRNVNEFAGYVLQDLIAEQTAPGWPAWIEQRKVKFVRERLHRRGCLQAKESYLGRNKVHEGFTIWFTGLSGSGKTTLAVEIERELHARGAWYVQRLDGDIVRQDLTRDLGFSKEDRDENIRRITFVAELLSKNGVATTCSFISPYREARATARKRCCNFIEVYTECPLETLIERDPKGLYKKALAGEITGFTGIDDPYEKPEDPEIVVHTGQESIEESANTILLYLEERGFIPESILASQEMPAVGANAR